MWNNSQNVIISLDFAQQQWGERENGTENRSSRQHTEGKYVEGPYRHITTV